MQFTRRYFSATGDGVITRFLTIYNNFVDHPVQDIPLHDAVTRVQLVAVLECLKVSLFIALIQFKPQSRSRVY